MKHSTSEAGRGVLTDPEAPPGSHSSEASEPRTATPDDTSESSPALPEAQAVTDERAPAPLPILTIDGSPPGVADSGGAVPRPASAPAPVTDGVRSATADESGEFLSARVEGAMREASNEATKVGLGVVAQHSHLRRRKSRRPCSASPPPIDSSLPHSGLAPRRPRLRALPAPCRDSTTTPSSPCFRRAPRGPAPQRSRGSLRSPALRGHWAITSR